MRPKKYTEIKPTIHTVLKDVYDQYQVIYTNGIHHELCWMLEVMLLTKFSSLFIQVVSSF
jgi:hypothetical protein